MPVSFKQSLIDVINDHLSHGNALPIEWQCMYCSKTHNGDLLKKVRFVLVAPNEDQSIHLLDINNALFGVIWFSKNKKFNIELSEQYGLTGSIFIQIAPPVKNESPLTNLSKPRFVTTCLNPKCKKCGGFQLEKSMVIIDADCWKCKEPMKVAVMDCDSHYPGPDEFSEEELAFARSKGVLIKNNYSKTVRKSYLSNTCSKCDTLLGNHYLFTDYFTEAIYGNYAYERVPQGYSCEHCDLYG